MSVNTVLSSLAPLSSPSRDITKSLFQKLEPQKKATLTTLLVHSIRDFSRRGSGSCNKCKAQH